MRKDGDPKLTPKFYSLCVNQLATDLESNRWKLAELANAAKGQRLDGWAETMALRVRRHPRTVREWAQAAEFRHSLPRLYDLPLSFYTRALPYLDRLPTEIIMDAMEQAEQDNTIPVDDYTDYLRKQAGGKVAKDLAELLDDAMARLVKLAEQAQDGQRQHIEAAIEELRLAREKETVSA